MKFVDFMADSRDFYTGLIDPVCKKYLYNRKNAIIMGMLSCGQRSKCADLLNSYE